MKLSKLYTNKNSFKNIKFNLNGLNVIYADVTTKLDETKNSHNLGKSLLIELIDFLLMKNISSPKDHFFKKATNSEGEKIFEDYVFYLELLLDSGRYLTIRRTVEQISKASFKIHLERTEAYAPPLDWDYENQPFKTSKEELDRLSITLTPLLESLSAICEPINPAPPVISILFIYYNLLRIYLISFQKFQ